MIGTALIMDMAAGVLGLVGGPLGRLIGGPAGERIATGVVDAAMRVTGRATPVEAVSALSADPGLVASLRRELIALERAELEAETDRLRLVNETMRVEATSGDEYVRRWRPTWGYVTAYAWAAQVGATVLAVIGATVMALMGDGARAATLLTAVGELWGAAFPAWGVALSVLGLSVHARSKDKAQGAATPSSPAAGLVETLFDRRGGK